MSDFHQSGPVTALPRLVPRPIEDLEAQAQALTRLRPLCLVIPIVPSHMDRPALSRILAELKQVAYLDTLVISLDQATAVDYARAEFFFSEYPGRKVILWNESPHVVEFVRYLESAGLYTGEPGKGRACWLALGLVLAEERTEHVAFQDAHVANFSREMLARLILPALDPTVDYDFVKGYYARFSSRLQGRVTRLLFAPLLAAFTRLMGGDPYIRYVASFRYALSGEFAVKCDLARRMRLPCNWGLEIVTIFEALRHGAANRICQVELAERYDHEPQAVSAKDRSRGIDRTARDVTKHLLRTLAAAGVHLSGGLLRSLVAAYQREAQDAVADSYAVARINGRLYDRHDEESAVQVFARALQTSIDEFLPDPLGSPLVPNWVRVWAGVPDAGARLLEAVHRSKATRG